MEIIGIGILFMIGIYLAPVVIAFILGAMLNKKITNRKMREFVKQHIENK